MELLLLLTALFASLTGSASDGSGSVRQAQGIAVVHAAEAAQAAVQTKRTALPPAAPARVRAETRAWPKLAAAPIAAVRLVFERRLE